MNNHPVTEFTFEFFFWDCEPLFIILRMKEFKTTREVFERKYNCISHGEWKENSDSFHLEAKVRESDDHK